MNGRWVKGRFYIGHDGMDLYFEPCGSHRVRLFEAIDHEDNSRIPKDAIDLKSDEFDVVRQLIRDSGQRLDTRTEPDTLAEAM